MSDKLQKQAGPDMRDIFPEPEQEAEARARGTPIIGAINTAQANCLPGGNTVYIDDEKFNHDTVYLPDGSSFAGYFRDGLSSGRKIEEAMIRRANP